MSEPETPKVSSATPGAAPGPSAAGPSSPRPYSEIEDLNAAAEAQRLAERGSAPGAAGTVGARSDAAASVPPAPEPRRVERVEPRPASAVAHPPAPEPKRAGRSVAGTLFWMLLALIAGAVIALVARPHYMQHLPQPVAEFLTPQSEQDAARAARVDELAAGVERIGDPNPAIARLEEQLAALEGRLAAEGVQVVPAEALSEATGATDALRADLAELETAQSDTTETLRSEIRTLADDLGTLGQAQETLAGEVDTLAATTGERLTVLETTEPPVTKPDFAGLDARLLVLENAEPDVSAEDFAGAVGRVEALEGTAPELSERITSLETAPPVVPAEDFAAVRAEVTALTEALAAATARADAAEAAFEAERSASAARVGELEGALGEARAEMQARVDEVTAIFEAERAAEAAAYQAELEAAQAALAAEQEAAAAKLAAEQAAAAAKLAAERAAAEQAARDERIRTESQRLATEFEDGLAYARSMETIEEASETPAPDALRLFADDGAPTMGQLLARFQPAADAAIRADVVAKADPSPLGKAGAWFESQIVGRPTEAREGEDVPATLSRIGAAVEAGDLDTALAESAALTPDAAAALDPWLDQVRARSAARAALDRWFAELGVTGS